MITTCEEVKLNEPVTVESLLAGHVAELNAIGANGVALSCHVQTSEHHRVFVSWSAHFNCRNERIDASGRSWPDVAAMAERLIGQRVKSLDAQLAVL